MYKRQNRHGNVCLNSLQETFARIFIDGFAKAENLVSDKKFGKKMNFTFLSKDMVK